MKLVSKQRVILLICAISYMFGGTISTLVSVYLPKVISDLYKSGASESDTGNIGAYINAIFLYGWMLGGLFFGVVADKIGRKRSLILVSALYGLATIAIIFTYNLYLFLALRFIAGAGVGGVLLIATVYISEIWEAKTRPIILGVLAIAFPVGIVTTGGLTTLFTEWRQAFWLGTIPCFAALLMYLFLYESEKWLTKKATKEISNISIFDNQYRKNLISGSLIFGSVLIGLWGLFSWLPTWVQSILPAGSDGQQERSITMMLLGIGGIIGGILSGFLIKQFGNRKTLIVTFGGLIVMSLILFLTNKSFSNIIYFETALLTLFFGISQGSLSSYIPALFPTEVRGSATGFCFNIGRFFTATAVFFVGAMVTWFGGFSNALLSFSLMFFIALMLAIRNPEIKPSET